MSKATVFINKASGVGTVLPRPKWLQHKNNKDAFFILRAISLSNRRTSIRLEPELWAALEDICHKEKVRIGTLFDRIDKYNDKNRSFTSSVRVYIVDYLKNQMTSPTYTAQASS